MIKRVDQAQGAQGPGALNQDELKPKDPLSADNLVRLTKGLAVGHRDRIFGTEKGKKAAEWLARQMKAAGCEPANGDSYFQVFTGKVGKNELTGRNVVGMIRGTDPALKDEVIIVAAHYDSQQDTHQGANDNATGCAGVLAIAQALKDNPPKRTVVFMTFDGEEGLRVGSDYSPGRRGSRFYAAQPLFPIDKTAMMVNMDELANVHLQSGRRDDIFQWASGDPFASRILKNAFAKTGGGRAKEGYPEQPREAQFFTTDAEPLYRLGVPTINLLSGRYLENHGPEDSMKLVIPERMETYGRLAAQCVIDAANHPVSLREMGIAPGGLMPQFPLINERRAAGLSVPEEEHFRLGDLHYRLPEFRKVCRTLIKHINTPEMQAKLRDVAGFVHEKRLVSEPNLNAVRERQKELLAAYRNIPKQDVAARKEAKVALDLLSGVEGVLAASLYILKIDTKASYYMQRVPERLSDLYRGASRLGMKNVLEGVVDTADIKKFKTDVNADRALEMARGALPGLQSALSKAVFALLDRGDAAKNEAWITDDHAHMLEALMTKEAYGILGKVEDREADIKRVVLIGAFLETTLARHKGTGDKWLARFADQNMMFDFGELARGLALPKTQQAEIERLAAAVDAAIFPTDLEALKPAMVAFYGALTEVAFGPKARANTLEDLINLPKDGGVQKAVEAGAKNIVNKIDRDAIQEAGDNPKIQALGRMFEIIKSTLELRRLFSHSEDGKNWWVSEDTSMREMKTRLEAVRDSLKKVDGGAVLAGELDFWTRWLTPFLDIEGTARMQAKDRSEQAKRGLELAQPLWTQIVDRLDPKLELDKGALQNPVGTLRALEGFIREAKKAADSEQGATPEQLEQKVRAEAGLKKVRPMLEMIQALETLTWSASPAAVFQLAGSVDALGHILGDPAVKEAREVAKKLEALRAQGEVEVGRKERSGPMGVLSVRAVQKRD